MQFKTLALTALFSLPILAAGQSKLSLTFESDAPRMVFTSTGWPNGLPDGAELKRVKQLEFPVGSLAPDDNLVVWDRDSNNAAIRQVSKIKDSWSVHAPDFSYIGLVKVRVEHEGSPVAAASVEISDKNHKQSQILDSSSKGEAGFFGLTPGEIKVSVNYRSNGKAAAPWKQGFEISLKRDRAEPLFVVSLPDPVETVSTAPAKPNKEAASGKDDGTGKAVAGKTEPPAGKSNPVGSFIVFLLSLAIAAGVIYGILIYIKNNQKQVADKLKSLGVDMPDPTPAGAMPPAPSVPSPAPEPPQKIILDDAAPTPLGPSLSVAAVSNGVKEPKLISDSGQVITLADGENLVGRDDGLIISLSGESTVSRRHAAVVKTDSSVTVKDLGSTNGTYVNGNKVDSERPLSPGDTVQFGQVRFRYET